MQYHASDLTTADQVKLESLFLIDKCICPHADNNFVQLAIWSKHFYPYDRLMNAAGHSSEKFSQVAVLLLTDQPPPQTSKLWRFLITWGQSDKKQQRGPRRISSQLGVTLPSKVRRRLRHWKLSLKWIRLNGHYPYVCIKCDVHKWRTYSCCYDLEVCQFFKSKLP